MESYQTPNTTVEEYYHTIVWSDDELVMNYTFDKDNYLTGIQTQRGFTVMKTTYTVVVGNELVDPNIPERGYMIYHVKETRNWLTNRLYSMLYMFLFVLAIIISLLLLVMGNRIHAALVIHAPLLGRMLGRLLSAKTFLVFVVLFLVFLVLYRYLPNRKASLKSQVPGAFIIAVAWSLFSYFFSLYFTFFPNFSNMYGSLSALIMVMLWLYVCMNLLLYGAEINAYFEKEFRQAQMSLWQGIKKLLDSFFALWHSR